MNQIYSLVLNHATGACQAVSEVAKGSHPAASATSGEACSPRRTRLASACLIALAALAGTSAWAQDTTGSITGTPGINGSPGVPAGTNGTAGAAAVQTNSNGTHSGVLTGGVGGTGGSGTVLGGDGGSGGAGLSNAVNNVVVFNTGSILGGQGGDGGIGAVAGAGGTGGTGVLMTAPGTLLNDGSIEGGRGGLGSPVTSAGGVGVTATASTSFENAGTVRGGLSGDGLSRADAIRFTGDNNFLGLISTSLIEGNVVGSLSNGDTLGLGGSTDASFDTALIGPTAQYSNFAGFQKLSTSTWTLTGTTTALTPWQILSGTLAISSDASLGDAAGPLTLNGGTLRSTANTIASRTMVLGTADGTLETQAGTTYTASGVISGSGKLTKTGEGTATFTADNAYTGNTAISAGTLELGNGGTSGAIAGDVTNNAKLAFNRSDTILFEGAISGTGSVEQRGTGTTRIAATNTYTGGTAISAGTLELGNGGAIGSIAGDVANSGTLAFNRADATVFDGVISGSGSVEQRSTGTTTLSGANTYSGGTSVLNGSLAGSAASFGSGAIVNNAALVLDQTNDGALNNVLSGAGRITKTGAGALTLAGNSAAFAGSTQVTAGTLAINGSLGGTLTVGNGARLAGTGSVGNTVVQSGATVAPGSNAIGMLNVAGNLTLAQGSVYQLNAASDGSSDQIRVSGAAALQGGSVSVLTSGNFQPSTSYSILNANGGVSGQFGTAVTDMAFLQPFLTYTPQNVTLRLQRNDVSFQNIAQTPNQRAAAGALTALEIGPLYSAVVALNAAGARTAFDSLSGEVHASLKSAAFEDSRFVRNASLGRLREAFDTPAGTATDAPAASGSGIWAQAFDSWGSTDADGNASSAERTTRGIFLGADTRVGDDWRLGVLSGYTTSRVTPDDRPSWAKTDTYHVGVYGGKQWGQLGLRAGATYSAGETDTRRDIAFPGFSGQTAAKYDINTTQAFGELGWKMPTANGSLEPFAGLAHVKLSADGFTESGGVAALSGSNSRAHTTYSTLGLRGTSNAGMPNNQTRLRGLVGWRHAFGDVTPTSTLALAGQPGFTVAGVPNAKNALVLEGGIDFAVSRNLTMGVSYVGQASSQASDHGIKASLLWKF